MPRSYYDDRSEYSDRRRGSGRVAEYEDLEIREHRRRGDNADFLRDDYGRNSNAGPLIVRDEEIIEERSKSRGGRRRKDREIVEEEELIVARSGNRERDRPRRKEREVVEEEEIIYRRPERERVPVSTETEEWSYRQRERSPPMLAREVEEWTFAPRPPQEHERVTIREGERDRPRERGYSEEEITIRQRERERERPGRDYRDEEITIRERERDRPHGSYHEDDITIRERERRGGRGDYREEEISIRERERDRPRNDYREEEIRISQREREGPRNDYRDEEIRIRERERDRPRDDYRDEEIRIRERERDGPRGDYRDQEIRIRERERDGPRGDYREEDFKFRERERDGRRGGYRDEETDIRIRERSSDGRRGGYRDEETDIRIRERSSDRSRRGRDHDHELIVRKTSASPSRERARPRRTASLDRGGYRDEELIIRKDSPGGREDIIIRRNERTPEPQPVVVPPPEPEPIRAPPIHQEIITHHRHIDHGFESYRPPVSAPVTAPPPRRRSPSPPRESFEEIKIRHKESRNGMRHEDDITISNRRQSSPARPSMGRQRSMSVDTRSGPIARRDNRNRDIDEEADYYARKVNERAYMGEAYNGATRDWSIVDVPPGTNRVKMDGIGGGSQEVTWQRYNGVRRSRFNPESDNSSPVRDSGTDISLRKFVGVRPKTDTMWTEITKDLVIKEAIERLGYEYEETEYFYYIMEYLKYEDVLRLVNISEEMRSRRRERIRQIEWENKMARAPPEAPRTPRMITSGPDRGWDEERIVEREFYERRSPRSAHDRDAPFPRPPLPPPVPIVVPSPRPDRERMVRREEVVVIRDD